MTRRFFPDRFWSAITIASLLLIAAPAGAGSLTVSPLRLTFENGASIVLVTVANPGSEEILVQADAANWQQLGSEHKLSETDAIIAMPPIFKLAPGASQSVRIGYVGSAPQSSQLTFRLLVAEVPTQTRPGSINVAVRHSLPILVMPATPTAAQLGASRSRENGIDLSNSGTALTRISHWRLRSTKGTIIAEADGPGYLLAGATQRLPLAASVAREPGLLEFDDDAGSHQLAVGP